jgi:D-sedoheptulose 7-phosphate isomerase
LWTLTAGGDDANIGAALDIARQTGLHRLIMTGRDSRLPHPSDLTLTVPAMDTARILEAHLLMGHMLCQLAEDKLFPHMPPDDRR